MSFFTEFKKFALRGNVFDLAVAVVIGTAFSKIVSALVDGVVMPLLGLLVGGINITEKSFAIGGAIVKWGAFLQAIIDFTIIAFAIFSAIKFINLLQIKKEEEPKPPLSREEALLVEIRDLLQGIAQPQHLASRSK